MCINSGRRVCNTHMLANVSFVVVVVLGGKEELCNAPGAQVLMLEGNFVSSPIIRGIQYPFANFPARARVVLQDVDECGHSPSNWSCARTHTTTPPPGHAPAAAATSTALILSLLIIIHSVRQLDVDISRA